MKSRRMFFGQEYFFSKENCSEKNAAVLPDTPMNYSECSLDIRRGLAEAPFRNE